MLKTYKSSDLSTNKRAEIMEEARKNGVLIEERRTNGVVINLFELRLVASSDMPTATEDFMKTIDKLTNTIIKQGEFIESLELKLVENKND